MKIKCFGAVLALLLAFGLGCGDDDTDSKAANNSGANNATNNAGTNNANNTNNAGTNNTGTNNAGTNNANNVADLPTFAELTDGEYNELLPGGDTICSRGTDYAFYVWPGSSDRVVINFFGGGACWNQRTCSVADAIFSDSVDNVRQAAEAGQFAGLFDMEDERNPVAEWTHIVVPYCTGDVHWGNSTQDYGNFTIEHKGAVNSQAVLDWVKENFPTMEKTLVTGCSAGSYGSIMWASHVANEYPDASVYQFGDSGAGVITETFFNDSFPQWNAEAAFPVWIDMLDPAQVDILTTDLPYLYTNIADYYPDAVFSQFNTRLDDNQTFYYEVMGGEGGAEGWSERMLANDQMIKDEHANDNYFSYLAPGEQHCIIPFDNFYTVESDGVRIVDWLEDMINDEAIDHVTCAECSGQ